jgi:serine/threonine protein kinase
MTFSSHSGRAGTLRYQAPELLSNKSSNHFGSDVYAFACVCYEVRKIPQRFSPLKLNIELDFNRKNTILRSIQRGGDYLQGDGGRGPAFKTCSHFFGGPLAPT